MSRKGGAGKTTVAVNLTLAARAMGVKAVLADADPLRSACEVLRDREEAAGLLFETSASKLFALTEACRRGGVELLVIDTPAAPEADVAEAVKVADLCLAVSRPTYLDLAAAVRSVAIIQRLGRDGMIVLNQCATARNGVEPPSVMKAFEALRFAGLPVTPMALRSRLIYQTAFAQGRSVLEIDRTGAASAECATCSATCGARSGARPRRRFARPTTTCAGPPPGWPAWAGARPDHAITHFEYRSANAERQLIVLSPLPPTVKLHGRGG
jgi:chromosome partitioning protein